MGPWGAHLIRRTRSPSPGYLPTGGGTRHNGLMHLEMFDDSLSAFCINRAGKAEIIEQFRLNITAIRWMPLMALS